MKLSEYIQKLQELYVKEGDLEVVKGVPFSVPGACSPATSPEVQNMKLLKKTEHVKKLWDRHNDDEERKGPPVVRI